MIEIIAEGYQLEVNDDLNLLINREISDLREPEKRTSDWSKTFTLPGTKVNNKFFNAFFEVGKVTIGGNIQQISDFKVNKKANCTIIAHGMEQLVGFLRLTEVVLTDTNQIEYNCTVHGETADLFTNIKDKKLSELDFSEYNHVLNKTNIVNSWNTSIWYDGASGTPFELGRGYTYSQMLPKRATKGYNSKEWRVDDHIPCLYAKTVIDKIFSDAGYRYTSDSFFNLERFKRLIIPYTNLGFTITDQELEDRLFKAQVTGNTTLTFSDTALTGTTIPAANDSTGGNFDNGNNYNNSTYKYTAPKSGRYEFYLNLEGSTSLGFTVSNGTLCYAEFQVRVNNVVVSSIKINGQTNSNNAEFNETQKTSVTAIEGDEISINFLVVHLRHGITNTFVRFTTINITNNTYIFNKAVSSGYAYKTPLDFTYFFVGEYTQTELLANFVKMFNLYIEPTQDSKVLRIQTRDNFYVGSVDWSQKLDYSQPYEIVPYGDIQGNPYKFSYKEGQDEENKQYKTNTNQVYGERTYRIDNDFIKNEKKIDITFAPTLLYEDDSVSRYYSEATNQDGQVGDLRILYYGGLANCSIYRLYNEGTPGISDNRTSYPLTLHIDDPANMQFDLLFGMPREIKAYLNLEYSNQNLVNTYYYQTLTEITDRDSKIFRGFFRITTKDWQTMKMSNLYFFEGQYWRLQKVTDYNPLVDDVFQCEFLLVKYYKPFTPTKKGLDFSDVINAGTGDAQQIPFSSKGGSTGASTKGVYVGNSEGRGGQNVVVGNLNAVGGDYNVVTSSERVIIPDGYDNITAIRCDNYQPPYTDRLYVENYPCLGSWMSGGKVTSVIHADSPYLATSEDWLILCNTSGGSITVTLPTPTVSNSGKMYTVKKTTSNHSVTVNSGDGSILIDDSTTHTQNAKNSFHQFVSDGTQYWIITQ